MNDNHYMQAGKSYLVRFEIPENISEEDRKNAEMQILGSIFYPEKHILVQGVITKVFYHSEIELDDVVTGAKDIVLQEIRDAVNKIEFQQIDKSTRILNYEK